MSKCVHIKENGEQCESYALKDKVFCFTHDPDSAEKRTVARREGGYKHVVLYNSVIRLKRGKIKNVMRFLAQTVSEVREGVITPQMANSIFMGCNSLIKCFEIYEIEAKLEKIEKYIQGGKDNAE